MELQEASMELQEASMESQEASMEPQEAFMELQEAFMELQEASILSLEFRVLPEFVLVNIGARASQPALLPCRLPLPTQNLVKTLILTRRKPIRLTLYSCNMLFLSNTLCTSYT